MGIVVNDKAFSKKVRIKISGEEGVIVAFSRHMRMREPQFLVEYQSADGRASEAWYCESQIEEMV